MTGHDDAMLAWLAARSDALCRGEAWDVPAGLTDPRDWLAYHLARGPAPAAPPPPSGAAPAVPLRELRALRRRAEACPHRTPSGSCGCTGWCALRRGRGWPESGAGTEVTLADCDACLRGQAGGPAGA